MGDTDNIGSPELTVLASFRKIINWFQPLGKHMVRRRFQRQIHLTKQLAMMQQLNL